MTIYNTSMANVKLGHILSELLGIGSNLLFITYVKGLTSPSTYFVHCDLVDKRQNLIFEVSPLKRFTTKQHNMFCVTR